MPIRYLTVCLLLWSAATAIADDNITDETLENITVTASRTDTLINNVGSSITIITAEEIQQRGARTLASLIRDAAGLAVNQPGGMGTLTQVRMRGAEANQVLVLIDGIEANDLSQGGEFNFAHVMTAGIERVEIVRGPQSALWGSDALAGVINIITRPRSPIQRSQVDIEQGSFGTSQIAATVDRSEEALAVAFSAHRTVTDGTNISRVGDESDGYDNTTFNTSIRTDIGPRMSATAQLRYTDASIDFDAIDFVTTGLPVDAANVTDTKQIYSKISWQGKISDNIEQIIAVHRIHTRNVNRTGNPVDDKTEGDKRSIVLQTNIQFDAQRLTLVAENETDDFTQRGEATFFGDPNRDLSTSRNAFAAEFRHDGDQYNLSASLRHENNEDFDDANTWRLTGLWRATDSIGLFASWGRSIKNPTFTERFGFFDSFFGNPDLQPEKSLAYEVGLRYHAGASRVSLSYFDAVLENEINGFVFDPDSGSFTARNTAGDSNRDGAELEASWQLSSNHSLNFGYTWLNASEPFGDTSVTEIRRPQHTASVRLNSEFGRVNFNIGAQYNGSQFDKFFPPFPEPEQRVKLSAYTLVDATVRYQLNQHLVLQARLENLLDEEYEDVFGFRSSGFGAYGALQLSW